MAIVWSCAVSVHVLLFGLQCGGLGKVVIELFLGICLHSRQISRVSNISTYLYHNYCE